jgi:HD-GYP domain-containing protein (c-di-GMP phosphodiesterase class II)
MARKKHLLEPLPVRDLSEAKPPVLQPVTTEMYIIDRDFRIVWANKTLEIRFSAPGMIKGNPCYRIIKKRHEICPGCPAIRVFEHGLDECSSIRHNTPPFSHSRAAGYVRITANPMRDEKENVTQVLMVIEGIAGEPTEDAQIKKRLTTVSKELDCISALDRQFICSREFSLDKVLKRSARIAPAMLGAHMCTIRLMDGSGGNLISRASSGLSKEYTRRTVLAVGAGVAGKVAASQRPVVMHDIATRADVQRIDDIKREGIGSLACVPIVLQKHVLGTLTVYDTKRDTFTDQDCTLLHNFANHIAILIDNINIHRKVFGSYINTIKSLVSAVEARDPYTRGHSEKVTKFCLDIADSISLSKDDRLLLSFCGRLHDIGKIAVPDSILNKRTGLTPAERAEIQMHPLKGVEILSNLKFLENGIPVVRNHHERYDGRGYPDGLKGHDIPLLARIIGCADAFDAMTSDRAYRRGMEMDKAIRELKVNKGRQFDPDILDAFLYSLTASPRV